MTTWCLLLLFEPKSCMMHEVGLDQSEREGAVSTDGRIGTARGGYNARDHHRVQQ